MGWDGKNISFCFFSPPLSLSVSSSTSCPFLSQPTASLLHSLLSPFLIHSLSLSNSFLSQLAATTPPPFVPSSPFLSPSPLYLLHDIYKLDVHACVQRSVSPICCGKECDCVQGELSFPISHPLSLLDTSCGHHRSCLCTCRSDMAWI